MKIAENEKLYINLNDLIEWLKETRANQRISPYDDYTDHTEDEYIAETLLDNFVTVWDGKPLEAFLHPIDAYKGLKAKYLVFKADTGESVDNCFILRPGKDPAAIEALRAYASTTDNEILAEDIYNWVGKGEKVQEWISVKDRLPEHGSVVLCFMKFGDQRILQWDDVSSWWLGYGRGDDWQKTDVTHWKYLPQPPKGE